MVWTSLTLVQQLEFAALFVLSFPGGDAMRETLTRQSVRLCTLRVGSSS
jgi:hypothetical protein